MTCIVGMKTPGGVYIGGDSASTNDAGLQTILASRKVFFIGNEENRMLLGCTTSCRMMQLLHYELQLPPYEQSMEVEEYLVTKFINAVRTCLKAGNTGDQLCPVSLNALLMGFVWFEVTNQCSLCQCPVSWQKNTALYPLLRG